MSAKSKNVLEILQTNISHRDYLTLRRRLKAFLHRLRLSQNFIHGIVSNGNVNTQIRDLDSYANEYFSQQTKIVERFSEVAPGNLRKSVTAIQKELLKLTYIFTQERLGNKRSL